jgi:hypothetical protein
MKKRTIDENKSFVSNTDSQATKQEITEKSLKGLSLKRKVSKKERNNLRL